MIAKIGYALFQVVFSACLVTVMWNWVMPEVMNAKPINPL